MPPTKNRSPRRERFFRASPVSRVLFSARRRSLHHLSTTAVTCGLKRPTPRHRTSNPWLSVYMVLQPVRRTAGAYCYLRGGLLPRLFTLTLAGGCFLLRYYALTDVKSLAWTALCVARTFLPPPKRAAMERACRHKGTNNPQNGNSRQLFLYAAHVLEAPKKERGLNCLATIKPRLG